MNVNNPIGVIKRLKDWFLPIQLIDLESIRILWKICSRNDSPLDFFVAVTPSVRRGSSAPKKRPRIREEGRTPHVTGRRDASPSPKPGSFVVGTLALLGSPWESLGLVIFHGQKKR